MLGNVYTCLYGKPFYKYDSVRWIYIFLDLFCVSLFYYSVLCVLIQLSLCMCYVRIYNVSVCLIQVFIVSVFV